MISQTFCWPSPAVTVGAQLLIGVSRAWGGRVRNTSIFPDSGIWQWHIILAYLLMRKQTWPSVGLLEERTRSRAYSCPPPLSDPCQARILEHQVTSLAPVLKMCMLFFWHTYLVSWDLDHKSFRLTFSLEAFLQHFFHILTFSFFNSFLNWSSKTSNCSFGDKDPPSTCTLTQLPVLLK